MSVVVFHTELPGLPLRRGKVRDVYELGDELLIVATDRISAYDVVLPTPIPGKGRLLTALSQFWFSHLSGVCAHHLRYVVGERVPRGLEAHQAMLAGRAMVCTRARVVPIECVVRGYLAGSGWSDYRRTGRVCGIELPAGLRQCARLPEPLFTPATKEESGHDQNVSFEEACARVGGDLMRRLRDLSLRLYVDAAAYALGRGILIADTKFEFGLADGRLLLIDEALTPDSSRFWPAEGYEAGRDQPSFDKQFVRNYLESLVSRGLWDKSPPGPPLPAEVVEGTQQRYAAALRQLVGPSAGGEPT